MGRSRHESRRVHTHPLLSVGLVFALAIGAVAFFQTWIKVTDPKEGTLWAFAAINLPVVNYVGGAWFVFIVLVGVVSVRTRRRLVCGLGTIVMVPTVVVLGFLMWVLYTVPRLLPTRLLPDSVRHYAPQAAPGSGLALALLSSVILLALFLSMAVHKPRRKA